MQLKFLNVIVLSLLLGYSQPLSSSDTILMRLYSEINKARQSRKLMPCTSNEYLEKASDRHAQDMQINNFTSHIGSDGSTFISRVKDTNAKFVPTGEIIAKGPGGKNAVENVVKAWLGSPGHAEILLNPMNLFCGGGYRLKNDRYLGNYWVVVFSSQN